VLAEANAPERAMGLVGNIAALSEVDRIACERIFGIVRSLKTFARVNAIGSSSYSERPPEAQKHRWSE